MLDLILKFGRAGTTAAVTVISVLISVSITLSLDFMLRRVFSPYSLTFSIVAPLLIAPWATWIIVGLVIRINQLEHEQRNLATYDALTGVLMRRAYLTMTQTCLEQAIEKNQPLGIAIIDIDNFKSINDTHGHGGGDAVLRAFSKTLRAEVRDTDLTGRIGGEEFAITLVNANHATALKTLERVRGATETTSVEYLGKPIRWTISIGFTDYQAGRAETVEQMMQLADQALYEAKTSGKNKVVSTG